MSKISQINAKNGENKFTVICCCCFFHFDYVLGSFAEVEVWIARLLHNMLLREVISEDLEDRLLLEMGMDIRGRNGRQWPLMIPARSLSVLGQVLLLRMSRYLKKKSFLDIFIVTAS